MTEIIISLEALSDISGKDIKLSKYDEVVTRCKDCKYFTRYKDCIEMYMWDGECSEWVSHTYLDWFCSRAERKEE